jgi:hypothetical protein
MNRPLCGSLGRLALQVILCAACTGQARNAPQVDLVSGPNARVRAEAARKLGESRNPAAAEVLRVALAKEREPRVVDAIIAALGAVGAPVSDPGQCRELLSRVWDASAAGGLFECWRASASPEDIDRAALSGPPVLRAHAMLALARGSVSSQPAMDNDRKQRLLDSLAEALSQAQHAAPGASGMLQQALWEFSGRNMPAAIASADRIARPEQRLAASVYLSQQNLEAYLAVRRPAQSLVGVGMAAAFALLMVWPKLRRAGALLAIAAACWAGWAWVSQDARQLPPLGLSLLTTSFIAILSAGVAAVLIGFLPWEKVSTGFMRNVGRIGLAGSCAGILAALITLWTRNAGWFPILQPGWDTIVEPMGALNLGIMSGGVFAILDGLLFRTKAEPKEPEPDPLAGLE